MSGMAVKALSLAVQGDYMYSHIGHIGHIPVCLYLVYLKCLKQILPQEDPAR